MKPNFLGIGAQKSASTWLYDVLADHPEVGLSTVKELDFFSNFYDYGFQWYERHFETADNRRVIGEVSPSYFHGVSVPERVHRYDPGMRLILFLREPVARAMSNHKHDVRIGHFSGEDLSFERGLDNNPMYIEQGLYATHLQRWLQFFPREQLLVVLFDDVVSDGAAVARQVYQFLGIDTDHRPAALGERSNESYVNRSAGVESAKNRVRAAIRSAGLGWLWSAVGALGVRRLYRATNRKPSSSVIPPMQPATQARLKALFAPELDRLEALAGVDLSRWR